MHVHGGDEGEKAGREERFSFLAGNWNEFWREMMIL